MADRKPTQKVADDVEIDSDIGLSARLEFLMRGHSARNFANHVGIKESTLRSVMKGTRPSIDLVVAIASATGASIEWLATGKGRPFKKGPAPSGDSAAVRPKINREIIQLVADAVERAHEAENYAWSPASVAAETIDAYDELLDIVYSPDNLEEVRLLMPWIEYNLRAVLRAAKRQDHLLSIEGRDDEHATGSDDH